MCIGVMRAPGPEEGGDRERAPNPMPWLDSQLSEQGSPATAWESKLARYQEVGFVSEHIAHVAAATATVLPTRSRLTSIA